MIGYTLYIWAHADNSSYLIQDISGYQLELRSHTFFFWMWIVRKLQMIHGAHSIYWSHATFHFLMIDWPSSFSCLYLWGIHSLPHHCNLGPIRNLIRPSIIGCCIYGSLSILWPSSYQVVCNTACGKIILGGTNLLLFQCFFYSVFCNDYETVVLSLNSRQRRMSFAMRSRSWNRGEFRAPDEANDLNSSLHASSNPDASALPTGSASTVPSPCASCRAEADDALCWLPRIPNVAVHATFRSRHLKGQRSVPSCRLIASSNWLHSQLMWINRNWSP